MRIAFDETGPLGGFLYRVFTGAVHGLARIPFPVSQRLGRKAGGLFARLPVARPRVAKENLLAAFGPGLSEEGAERLYRRLMAHFGAMLFELPHIFRLREGNLSRYLVFEHPERFERALAGGKGCFILTAHFGNWELMSAATCLRYAPNGAVVVRPLDFPPLERLFRDLRTRFGTEIIPKDRAMRRVMKALKENRAVGILLDQNVDWYEGVFVPFMGRWACTNKGLALMALKTGAPVMPIFSIRQPDGRYRVVFEKEIALKVTGDKIRDVEENTRLFTKVIERYARLYPEQWFWFHRRWKTRPYCPLPDSSAEKAPLALRMRCREPIVGQDIRRILVRAPNWVGDMVMCLPALEALRDHFPSVHITVLARPWVAALLRAHPAVDDVLLFEQKAGRWALLRERLRLIRVIRAGRFDLAVLFQNAFEAAALAFLGGVPRRLGYDTDGRGFLLTHRIVRDPAVLQVHQVAYYLAILRAAGMRFQQREPRLFVPEEDAAAARAWLEKAGIGGDELVVGLSPGAMYGSAKRWPEERFAAVGDRAVSERGARVLIFGSGKEAVICANVARAMRHPAVDLAGRTSLGLATALIGRCDAFVTNDSGLMHIAAALGVPTTAVFGSTDWVATGPRGPRTVMVRHAFDCAPCLKKACPRNHGCMLSIQVEEVWEALAEVAGWR